MKLVPVLLCIMFVSGVQCTQQQEIHEDDVARIIRTLSSDSMQGRGAFSKEIKKSADFIASEFEDIGLESLDEEKNYLQEFSLVSVKAGEGSVKLNGKKVDPLNYFARAYSEQINWSKDDVKVFLINKNDNLRTKIRSLLSDSISSLVLVDETHYEWFNRHRLYFQRPNRTFSTDEECDDIFVLTPEKKAHSFQVTFNNSREVTDLYNITGKIEGNRKDEIVLFSAHYDHIGISPPIDGDSIANGANDNASGVAAVIELARYFKNGPKPERTIYFVAFTAEESGGYGSKFFSRQLDPDQIVAMINIEMIGKPAVDGPNTAWITGYDLSSLGEIMKNSIRDSSFVFYPDPYPKQNLFYRSDNATLARLGVPAHSISTTPIDVDENYHNVSDEFSTIHISHATNTIQAIARASKVIISGKKTPTRIPPMEEE